MPTPIDERAALWKATNAALLAGTFTKDDFVKHLREETALAAKDPVIDLEATLVMGTTWGFIKDAAAASDLLAGK